VRSVVQVHPDPPPLKSRDRQIVGSWLSTIFSRFDSGAIAQLGEH
jgi:hypothetical protein